MDADVLRVGALGESDPRSIDVRVAGPAALLVSKVHRIRDRSGTARRNDKDALDVLRLLRGTATTDMAARMRRLLEDLRAAEVTAEALALFRQQFAVRNGTGIRAAVRAVELLEDPEEISASCELLAGDLLREVAP